MLDKRSLALAIGTVLTACVGGAPSWAQSSATPVINPEDFVPAGAISEKANIGGVSVELAAPPGHCKIEKSRPSDAGIVTAVENALAGENQLLAMFADCQQLEDWRSGKRALLDDIAQYQTRLSLVAVDIPGPRQAAVQEICKTLRGEGAQLLKGMEADIKGRMESAVKSVKVNEIGFLGVVAEDPDACYSATLQKMTQAGTEKIQLCVFATTVVKGRIIYSYLFTPFHGAETVTRLLERQRKNIAALLSANW